MGLRLRPKNPARYQVGNAIIYGGKHRTYEINPEQTVEAEIFYVETDFGNHLKLTWGEIEDRWVVVGWQNYDAWLTNRDILRNQPNLLQQDMLDEMPDIPLAPE